MLVYFKHVDLNERFGFALSTQEERPYIKTNHQRGRLDIKGKPQYHYFKKNDLVCTEDVPTSLTAWMEVK